MGFIRCQISSYKPNIWIDFTVGRVPRWKWNKTRNDQNPKANCPLPQPQSKANLPIQQVPRPPLTWAHPAPRLPSAPGGYVSPWLPTGPALLPICAGCGQPVQHACGPGDLLPFLPPFLPSLIQTQGLQDGQSCPQSTLEPDVAQMPGGPWPTENS